MKLILFLAIFFLAGCSHSQMMKNCKQVEDDDIYVCKTVKPWD